MKLLWINCDSALDRAASMISQCNRLGLDATRISALLGRQLTFTPAYGANAYACLLSHLYAQSLLKSVRVPWVLIAEDDIVMDGVVSEDLFATAPADATLLQLTTLTGSHYQSSPDSMPLWTPIKNGYYGTQLYAVRTATIAGLFDSVGIIDVLNYLREPLPDVPNGLQVADSYTYCLHKTYLCSYPFAYSDIKFGSHLHPEHLDMHEEGWEAVRSHMKKFHNPYMMEKYDNND